MDPKQITLLKFLLPIVGGGLAWTISGTIKVTTNKLIPDLVITASGGFAVYIASSEVFDSNNTSLICPTEVAQFD